MNRGSMSSAAGPDAANLRPQWPIVLVAIDRVVDRVTQQARREKPGRPKVGRGAKRVLVSVELGLLEKPDDFAREHGKSRSQLVAEGLRLAMNGK